MNSILKEEEGLGENARTPGQRNCVILGALGSREERIKTLSRQVAHDPMRFFRALYFQSLLSTRATPTKKGGSPGWGARHAAGGHDTRCAERGGA